MTEAFSRIIDNVKEGGGGRQASKDPVNLPLSVSTEESYCVSGLSNKCKNSSSKYYVVSSE